MKYQEKYEKLFHFNRNIFAILMKNKEISQNSRNSMKILVKNHMEISNAPICPKKLVSDV